MIIIDSHVSENEDILMSCLLELAKDVGIFCRDAGGLQDRHPEGKHITDPQVLQGCVELTVQTGLQRDLQLICTSCEESHTGQNFNFQYLKTK